MKIMIKSALARFLGGALVVLGLTVGPLFTYETHAQSASNTQALIQSLQAQIQLLLTQINALQRGVVVPVSTYSACPYTWTRDLSVGSSGLDVLKLQQFLNSDPATQVSAYGPGSRGQETQVYGPLTASAVSRFQTKYRAEILGPYGLFNGTGYFGVTTRAKANALCGVVVIGDGPTQGPSGDTNGLSGGAGSIQEFQLIAKYNNEEVGERQKNVKVAGLAINVDRGSDIRLAAVRLVFDEEDADSRFSRYADEVALYLDGKEVARVDADQFTRRNDWSKTISLDRDAVIRAGRTGDLVVAVSGARNVDSADEGESWNVDFDSVRYVDAQGATISENPHTSARSFSFESFASAANIQVKILDGDEGVNDPRTIGVKETKDTDDVPVLSFEMDVRGSSDITIDSLPVRFSVTGADDVDDLINVAYLYIDGERVSSVGTSGGLGSSATLVFNNLDVTLEAGERYEFGVRVDFNRVTNHYDEGDTIAVAFGETETDSNDFDAFDEIGEDLSDTNVSGSVSSGPHALYQTGIFATFVSASESVRSETGTGNDHASFQIVFDVESFGGTTYISKKAAATTTLSIDANTITPNGILYVVKQEDDAVDTGLSAAVSVQSRSGNVSETANGYQIEEGERARVTLSVVRTNQGSISDRGFYNVALAAIGWNSDGSSTFNVYDFNLSNFKTDYEYLD